MKRHGSAAATWDGAWAAPPGSGKGGLLSDRVAHSVERFIADQQLKPGDRLPSGRELTDRYGVSRTVVRDAIAILEQRGLVETRPGSGVFVRDGGSDAVAGVLGQMLRHDAISLPELMEARILLEVHNAAMAAQFADAPDIEKMGQEIEEMRTAAAPVRFVEADALFHEGLAQAAGNRVLTAFLRSLRPLLLQGMMIGTHVEGAREAAIREHGAILDAIQRQEGATARTLMSDHLRRSYNEWAQAGSVDPTALRLPRPD